MSTFPSIIVLIVVVGAILIALRLVFASRHPLLVGSLVLGCLAAAIIAIWTVRGPVDIVESGPSRVTVVNTRTRPRVPRPPAAVLHPEVPRPPAIAPTADAGAEDEDFEISEELPDSADVDTDTAAIIAGDVRERNGRLIVGSAATQRPTNGAPPAPGTPAAQRWEVELERATREFAAAKLAEYFDEIEATTNLELRAVRTALQRLSTDQKHALALQLIREQHAVRRDAPLAIRAGGTSGVQNRAFVAEVDPGRISVLADGVRVAARSTDRAVPRGILAYVAVAALLVGAGVVLRASTRRGRSASTV